MKNPNITAQAGKVIICRGPFCFGFGKDTDTAYKNAKKHAPRDVKPEMFSHIEVPEDATVNDMGGVCWKDGSVKSVKIGYGRLAE